jgi:NADH-quinone oxidoreductase subunit N
VTVYLGLELLSLSLYAMVAMNRDSIASTEAAMKYFVLGALASGLLLYGMSMIYGATGTLEITGIAERLFTAAANKAVLVFGLVFLVAGLAFKLGVVPFHMWIPDVYHGAPTSVTLFIGSAPKLAAFAIVMRLLVNGLLTMAADWQNMLIILSVLSMAIGNLAAIAQTNLKRMLAYSAISHMGFMLLGIVTGVVGGDARYALNAYSSAMFYVLAYVLMSAGTFGMILLMARCRLRSGRNRRLQGPQQAQPVVCRRHADVDVLDGRRAVLHRLLRQVLGAAGRRRRRLHVAGHRCSALLADRRLLLPACRQADVL